MKGVKFLTSCRSANLISLINVNPIHRLGKATAAHVTKQGITSMLCSYTDGHFLVAHDISPDQAWQREVRSGRPLKNTVVIVCFLGLLEHYDAEFRQEILLPN